MGSKPTILIAEPRDFSRDVVEELRRHAEVTIGLPPQMTVSQALDACDVFWFRLAYRIDRSVLSTRPRCRILATPVTGLDHVDESLCAALGIRVISLKGEQAFLKEVRATAELTLGLVISLLRRIPAASRDVLEGHWDRDRFRGHELHGKTAGIIGYGRLGSMVADCFHALGVRVLAYDMRRGLRSESVCFVDAVEDLVERSDVVSLHVSYTPESHHLLDAGALSRFKPGAVLINTSRGAVVDEAALLAALKRGTIAGAALDVLTGEPDIDRDHPLVRYARGHENLLIVPHIGGNTYESFEKTEWFLARKVLEALRA